MSPKNRRENCAAELRRAEEALWDAEDDLGGNRVASAINRAYYAVFHAARGLLYLADEQPKTHADLSVRFRAVYADTGRIPPEAADDLDTLARARGRADYAVDYEPGEFETSDLVGRARRFVERARAVARAEGG